MKSVINEPGLRTARLSVLSIFSSNPFHFYSSFSLFITIFNLLSSSSTMSILSANLTLLNCCIWRHKFAINSPLRHHCSCQSVDNRKTWQNILFLTSQLQSYSRKGDRAYSGQLFVYTSAEILNTRIHDIITEQKNRQNAEANRVQRIHPGYIVGFVLRTKAPDMLRFLYSALLAAYHGDFIARRAIAYATKVEKTTIKLNKHIVSIFQLSAYE